MIIVRYVDMFTGQGPDVGIFTLKPGGEVHLEIFQLALNHKDSFMLSILESMQKNITTREMLFELIETTSPYSSLQFFRA